MTTKLTIKEEEIMNLFWDSGAMFVRELLDCFDEPKPHFNTVSTTVRGLEEKGFVSHKIFGNTFQYFASTSKEEFTKMSLKGIIGKYCDNSAMSAVSMLVQAESISVDELKELIKMVERK